MVDNDKKNNDDEDGEYHFKKMCALADVFSFSSDQPPFVFYFGYVPFLN